MRSLDSVLAGLDPQQREVATAITGSVCVIAGAGSGKTRAVTHRIAYGAIAGTFDPAHVLAVTFTTRAAGEMRHRLRALGVPGVQARTFHSAALRQLQHFWPTAVGGPIPRVLDSKAKLVAEAANSFGRRAAGAVLFDLIGELEWAAARQIVASEYAVRAARAHRSAPTGWGLDDVASLAEAYGTAKADAGLMDFDDVLLLTIGILQDSGSALEAVHAQYRHFTVDEYQDVSPLQQRLLDLWVDSRSSLCVVGDPRQTIYTFAGADPSFLEGFPAKHPDAALVQLVRNYRCAPAVVTLANSLPGESGAAPLVAMREGGSAVQTMVCEDDGAEAHAIAERARRLHEDYDISWRDMAVLFRTNAQSEPFERAFADMGIPVVVRGGQRFFDRPEIKRAMVLLRGTAARAEDGAGSGDWLAQVREVADSLGLSTVRPEGRGAEVERWDALTTFVRLGEEFARDNEGTDLRGFVNELEGQRTHQHTPASDGVTLASMHAAKGLEWDAVFIAGLSEGLMPIAAASTPTEVAEERRLLYVAITRARDHLCLSYSRAREAGRRDVRRATRFLLTAFDLDASTSEPSRERSRDARRGGGVVPTRCRFCGGALVTARERKLDRCKHCPAPYDPALMEALRAWRRSEAEGQSVPAYVVFTDATLESIAEHTPTDQPGLRRIPGIGAVKAERYGEAVIDLVARTQELQGTS